MKPVVQQTHPRCVIVDVDGGSDDAIAIMMLLEAEKRHEVKVLGITCVYGNTCLDNVVINILRILEAMNRLDIPVYKGASEVLVPISHSQLLEPDYHGKDGFGDVVYDHTPDVSVVKTEHAVNAMQRVVSELPGQVTIIALGPLTNIALAMKMYSDFSSKCKDLYIMGGNYRGIGNTSNTAEFNFIQDPEAAHIVLESAKCPMFILPWEPCLHSTITQNFRTNFMGKIDNPQMRLINAAENSIYTRHVQTRYLPCDAACSAYFLNPDISEDTLITYATVELHGLNTRGQVVIDHLKTRAPNVHIVQKLNDELLKKMLLFAAGHENSGY